MHRSSDSGRTMCDGQNEAVSWSRQDKSINRRTDMTQKGEREDHAGQGQGTTVHVYKRELSETEPRRERYEQEGREKTKGHF